MSNLAIQPSPDPADSGRPIVTVKDLEVNFYANQRCNKVLGGISFSIRRGRTLCVVGESGCGKSVTASAIMRLLPRLARIENGSITYHSAGGDIRIDQLDPESKAMRSLYGKEFAMIFQDPMTALNPVMTVGDQIAEAVRAHDEKTSSRQAMKTAEETLVMVGIPAERSGEYPHQFSGGMKQRVVIAMALACRPKVLIADEPTTALDVTIQAQVLEMMNTLRRQLNMAMLLITHDLGVVAQNCDCVAVIYAGEIMEYGTVFEVFDSMCHPYTIGLFNSLPSLARDVRRLVPIEGLMPDPTALPAGCTFSPRCPFVQDICRAVHPGMTDVGGEHSVRCHFPRTGANAGGPR